MLAAAVFTVGTLAACSAPTAPVSASPPSPGGAAPAMTATAAIASPTMVASTSAPTTSSAPAPTAPPTASPSRTPGAATQPTTLEATGIVLDVEGSSPVDVRAFTLRAADGETLRFRVGTIDVSGGGFTPSHLREHMASAEPVRVVYRVEGDERVAIRLFDAP